MSTHYSNRCIVISIPVLMLWHVRISIRLKSILIGLFSVTVVVMITAIIRVTTVTSVNEEPDYSWLYVWNNIEMTTCMRLPPPSSCLPPCLLICFSVVLNQTKNRLMRNQYSYHNCMHCIISPVFCYQRKPGSTSKNGSFVY